MQNEHFKIIEINGVKMQVDLRTAKVIDEYKVGDNIKVLIKSYNDDYKSYIGTIIGFDDFKKTPCIVIACLKIEYSSAKIEFLYYNEHTKDAEIAPLNEWDLPLTKSEVLDEFHKEQTKKEQELKELRAKENMFEKLFGKYFEKQIA